MRKPKAALILENAVLTKQLEQFKNTVIRVSLPTELGIRPIYQATVMDAILMTRLAGGNGIVEMEGPTIEVISEWLPTNRDIDDLE